MARQEIEVRLVDKVSRGLRGIEGKINGLNSGLLGINRIAALAAGAVAAIGGTKIITGIVNTTARFEDLRTTLASVTGSAQDGAKAFEFVSKFSTETQFGIEELSNAYIKLQSNGITPTRELLTTFTDAAAVTTDQLGVLQSMTDFYTRTLQSQVVELTDLERLADRGLPVYDILKEKLGVSRGELNKFSKEAGNAEKVVQALGEGINERFGGATQARLQNLSTRFSNLQIAITNAADAIGRQGFGLALGEVTEQITNYITKNDEAVKKIGLNLTKAFLIAVDAIKLVIKNIEFLGKAFIAFFALKIGLAITGITIALARGLYPALLLAAKGVQFLTKAIRRNPLLAIGGAIAIGIAEATGALDALFGKLQDLGQEAIAGAGQKLVDGLQLSADAVGLNVDAINEFQSGLGTVNDRALNLQTRMNELAESSTEVANATGNTAQNTNDAAEGVQKTTEELNKQKKALEAVATTINEGLLIAKPLEKQFQELTFLYDAMKSESFETFEDIKKAYEKSLLEQDDAAIKSFNNRVYLLNREISAVAAGHNEMLAVSLDFANKEAALRDAIHTATLLHKRTEDEKYLNVVKEMNDILEDLEFEKQDAMLKAHAARIQKVLYMEKDLTNKILNEEDRRVLQTVGNNERYAEIVANRIEFEKKSELGKTQFALEQGVTMFEGLSKVNKKFFAAQKAAAIALAIVNTYQGATKALATYPPPFNFIAAAATVASGLAQVATIRAQTMQRGGALPQGQAAIVGEDGPELIVPKQPSTVIPREVADAIDNMGGRGGDPVVVNFNITTVDAESFDTLLIRRRGTITSIIYGALQKRGKEGVV